MVAVSREDVVGGPLELFGGCLDDRFYLLCGCQGEALEDLTLERASRWFRLWPCPVDARHAALIMPAVCVLFSVNDDARVEERGAYRPQNCRELARLHHTVSQRRATEITFSKCKTGLQMTYREQIIDIDHDFGLLQRQSVSMSRTGVAPFGGFAGRHGGGGEVRNEETVIGW